VTSRRKLVVDGAPVIDAYFDTALDAVRLPEEIGEAGPV
jgi:hypothetical protein